MKNFWFLIGTLFFIAVAVPTIILLWTKNKISQPKPIPTTISNLSSPSSKIIEPIADFQARINKKPFGIYVNPQNSPVQSERFTGYHTGADAEYQETATDVPVYAVVDGKITLSRTASGYGGVFILEAILPTDNKPHSILYGHIRPSSLPGVGTEFKKGDQIALLGTGFSPEADGERRHLHFGILSDNRLDILGYVQTKSDLTGWLDPLNLF